MPDRHHYLPPRYPVQRGSDPALAPPIAALTDPDGDTLYPADAVARIRLAWTAEALLLHASHGRAPGFLDPSLATDHPHFWRQDGIELHLERGSERGVFQLILTADGRCFDSDSVGLEASGTVAAGAAVDGTEDASPEAAGGWWCRVAVPWALLGVDRPAAGLELAGQVVHTRWDGSVPTMAGFAATALGHGQRARFGRLVLAEASAPALVGVAIGRRDGEAAITSVQLAGLPPDAGTLHVQCDGTATHLPIGPAATTTVPLHLPLQRPRFTHLAVAWIPSPPSRPSAAAPRLSASPGPTAVPLGAVTLRAPVPPAPAEPPPHPRLFLDAPGLAACRAKLTNPVFAELLAATGGPRPWSPAPVAEPTDFRLDAADIGSWFRFAKETLLRDGQRRPNSAAGRLWAWLTPDARAAATRIVDSVGGAPTDIALLLRDLNAALARADLYDPAVFGPDAARRVAARGLPLPPPADPPAAIRRFNRLLLQETLEFVRPCGAAWLGHIGGCLLPWVIDGDPRWIARATACVRAALAHTLEPHYTELHPGMDSQQLALAYDAFHPHLAPAERADWQTLLGRLLAMYLRTARDRHWNCTTIANANPVCNAGGGLLALVLLGHDPRAPEALAHARAYLWRYLDGCFGDDGGCTEGLQYFEYGAANYLHVARALERVTGTDDTLIDNPIVRRWTANLAVALCNDGSPHGVNDTIPCPVAQEVAWFLGTRFADPLAAAYADHALRIQAALAARLPSVPYRPNLLWTLLTRPDTPLAPALPPLPTALHLPSIEVAILRSEPRWDCALDAGLKGSRPPYTHHNQADTGSLFLDLRGERLLIDPGYYKDAPTDHCLPVIDGHAPRVPDDLRGHITHCTATGPWRHATIDSTAAYRGHATRVRRHLLFHGPATAIVIDDIAVPPGSPGQIRSWWQAGGPTARLPDTPTGATWRIDGDAAALHLQVLIMPPPILAPPSAPPPTSPSPSPAATLQPAPAAPPVLTLHPERTLHDTHWGYHFALCRWFPVSLDYTVAPASDPAAPPCIHVITDAAVSPAPALAPAVLEPIASGWQLHLPGPDRGTLQLLYGPDGLTVSPLSS